MPDDPWDRLRAATCARIGLGRSGDALPTPALLDLQLAHALARDAVHRPLDVETLAKALAPRPVIAVHSAAADRATYLCRPDLGRRLDETSRSRLQPGDWDAVFIIADGLSAAAVADHAAAVLDACLARLEGWRIAPIVLAEQARVALGDEIGTLLGARLCVLLVGERPGLTVANSLGAYLTWDPSPGRRDSERNCVSNIHAAGLTYAQAADTICWLMNEARSRKLTGVGLKADGGRLIG